MTPDYRHNERFDNPSDQYANAIETAFRQTFGDDIVRQVFGGEWSKQERSRAPYKDAWKLGEGEITLFASDTLTHCCVEISGRGCEVLIENDLMLPVLKCVQDRVTRIDIAVDMQTETTPEEFVSERTGKRSKSNGFQNSASGSTYYIGSQTSDSYARVYRYKKPHPRSHLLRAEQVFRRDVAKSVVRAYISDGEEAVTKAVGQRFGWSHADWRVGEVSAADLRIDRTVRDDAKTVFWLVHSVAPAFKRLVQSGEVMDREEFLRRYFLDD